MIENLSAAPSQLALQLNDVDLNSLIKDAVGKLPINGAGHVQIHTDFSRLPRIRADVDELYKVIHNLLLNACEAMNDSGHIRVSTRVNGSHVVLSVQDNGPGMSPEFKDTSLFKPFCSTKKRGLGIGLYQCKTIVEAHSGRIEVESELGKGTTFRVLLPRAGHEREGASK